MDFLKGWRTMIFNAIIAILGVLEAANWIDIVPQEYVPIILAVIGFINMWLRKITNTALGQKTPTK